MLNEVRDEVQDYSGGELADDLCMVALRVTAGPRCNRGLRARQGEVLSAELSS